MKNYYEIAPLKIIRAENEVFTYSSEIKLQCGQIVEIPVGQQVVIGVVWRSVKKPDFETREIQRIISGQPIPEHLIELSKWVSQYYATPLAQVLSGILPAGIAKSRRLTKDEKLEMMIAKKHGAKDIKHHSCSNFLYTEQQQSSIEKLDKINSGTILLHGITGSGKTLIYINQAEKVLSSGRSVIILVPEIALTSQLVLNFEKYFKNIIRSINNTNINNRSVFSSSVIPNELSFFTTSFFLSSSNFCTFLIFFLVSEVSFFVLLFCFLAFTLFSSSFFICNSLKFNSHIFII